MKTREKSQIYLSEGAGGIYGIRNKETGRWSEVWGAWGKMIGKRCGNHASAQVQLSYSSLHVQRVTMQKLAHAQLEGW